MKHGCGWPPYVRRSRGGSQIRSKSRAGRPMCHQGFLRPDRKEYAVTRIHRCRAQFAQFIALLLMRTVMLPFCHPDSHFGRNRSARNFLRARARRGRICTPCAVHGRHAKYACQFSCATDLFGGFVWAPGGGVDRDQYFTDAKTYGEEPICRSLADRRLQLGSPSKNLTIVGGE